jgi:hypothetical protein
MDTELREPSDSDSDVMVRVAHWHWAVLTWTSSWLASETLSELGDHCRSGRTCFMSESGLRASHGVIAGTQAPAAAEECKRFKRLLRDSEQKRNFQSLLHAPCLSRQRYLCPRTPKKLELHMAQKSLSSWFKTWTVTPSQADLICPNYDFHSRHWQSCSPQAAWLRRTGSLRGLRPGNLTSKFQLVQVQLEATMHWHSDSRLRGSFKFKFKFKFKFRQASSCHRQQ